jgi:hypothetical protein
MSVLPPDQVIDPARIACARCGAPLDCNPAGDCWCKREEVRLPVPTGDAGCLCAACLRATASIGTGDAISRGGA